MILAERAGTYFPVIEKQLGGLDSQELGEEITDKEELQALQALHIGLN
jgi:hypothetical protein